jgi:hypothetical protein
LPLIGGEEIILGAFCSSARWQIYQTLYLLFRMQERRFATAQDAGMIVLSMGDGILAHLPWVSRPNIMFGTRRFSQVNLTKQNSNLRTRYSKG